MVGSAPGAGFSLASGLPLVPQAARRFFTIRRIDGCMKELRMENGEVVDAAAVEWDRVESVPTQKDAYGPVHERVEIDTREGTVVAAPGDYIIRESDGNVYPISADKFERYYRRVDA